MKGKRVTLSEETKNGLAEVAQPFETPDECINRMLSCACVKKELKKQNEKQDDFDGE